MEEQREEEQVQSVDAAFQGAEDEILVGDLAAVVLGVLLGLERRNARNGVEPIENAAEGHEVVGSVVHTDGGDGGPGEERRGGEGNTGEEEALQGEHNRRILDLNPPELERDPNADQEIRLGAEERGEAGEHP